MRNVQDLPPLTEAQILAWADAHHARPARGPRGGVGPVADAPGETLMSVEGALRSGVCGLQGGSSLAIFLREHGRGSPAG